MATQYLFGYDGGELILKTVGEEHTDLTGALRVTVRTDVDETTHSCTIARKYRSAEGADGLCYDWYAIRDYYRDVDRTEPIKTENKQARADIDYIAMETGVEL